MTKNFHYTFKSVMIMNIIAGICIPGLPVKYKKFDKLLISYCLFAQLVCLGQAVACIIILIDYTHAKNFVHTASILSLYLSSLFWSVYLIINRESFEKIIRRFDIVIKKFNNKKVVLTSSFENNLITKFQLTRKMMIIIFVSLSSLPVVNNTQKLIRSWQLFGLDGEKVFNYQVPYSAHTSPIYEITILMQASSLFWTCTEQGCSIYLFVTFYYLLSFCFKYLQISIHHVLPSAEMGMEKHVSTHGDIQRLKTKEICSAATNNPGNNNLLKFSAKENEKLMCDITSLTYWIKMHQEVLR